MTTWLNTSFEMRFRVIDGLTVRYAQSEDYCDHALLLSPWPESLLAFMPMWESMRYVRSYPTELPVLSGLLPQVDTPVQIIAGAHDTAVPAVNAEYLHQRLPHSKLDIIDSGHFSWEDAPGKYAGLVTRWWGGGYLADAAKE